MKREIIALLLIASIGFSALSITAAKKVVDNYTYAPGESSSMAPQQMIDMGTGKYYVFEIISLNEIVIMMPVDVETGEIYLDSDVSEVIKTHYFANFFDKDDYDIKGFLVDSKDEAFKQRATLLSNRDQISSNIMPSLGDISVAGLDYHTQYLQEAMDAADALVAQKMLVESDLASITTPASVIIIKSDLELFFSKQSDYYAKLDNVVSSATDVQREANTMVANGQLDSDLRTMLISSTSYDSLKAALPDLKANLESNRNNIIGFIDSLDEKAAQYKIALLERVSGSLEKQKISKQISAYIAKYSEFSNQSTSLGIPSDYEGVGSNMEEMLSLIRESSVACSGSEFEPCNQSKETNFPKIDELSISISGALSAYSGSGCGEGETQACEVDGKSGKQACSSGAWGACEASAGLSVNPLLIVGVVLIVVLLLVLKFKDRLMPPKQAVQASSGSWQTEQYKF